ncbi:hypothetical protein BOX15_Mlig011687g1, partial [Macrostomum lignano]
PSTAASTPTRMGGRYSHLPAAPACLQSRYFCLTFRAPDRISLIASSQDTLELIRSAIAEAYKPGIRFEYDDHGSWSIILAGCPFKIGSSRSEAIAGKLAGIAILRRLLSRGWRAVVSSDLCRSNDLGTWFFSRTEPGVDFADESDRTSSICCLALSSSDRLQLIGFPASLTPRVVDRIRQEWSCGVQRGPEAVCNGQAVELKLHGNPWLASEQEAVDARQMLLAIVREMHRWGCRLYLSSSLKDTTDSLFFLCPRRLKPPVEQLLATEMFVLSLNRRDRLRLMGTSEQSEVEDKDCNQLMDVIRECVLNYWPKGLRQERDWYGARELHLTGSPWWTEGSDSVHSRLLITLLLQRLRQIGWRVVETVDVCRRLSDKSILLFERSPPRSTLHCCISLNGTSLLRFINAPEDVVSAMRHVVSDNYARGIKSEKIYAGYHQIHLRGQPWSAFSGNDHMHGRHLMLAVLSAMRQDLGWSLVCSADVSAKYHHSDSGQDYPLDVHSWWFSAPAASLGNNCVD